MLVQNRENLTTNDEQNPKETDLPSNENSPNDSVINITGKD